MQNQNLDESYSEHVNSFGGFVSQQVEQPSYVTMSVFNQKYTEMAGCIEAMCNALDKLSQQHDNLSQKISIIDNNILDINNQIQQIVTKLNKKLNKDDFNQYIAGINTTINDIKANYYSKTDFKIGDYYTRTDIDDKFNNYYNKNAINHEINNINQKFTDIDNTIKSILAKINELEKMKLKIQQMEKQIIVLQKQGGNNKALMNEYLNNITEMMSLTQKNFKLYNRENLIKEPGKIFAFLYNNMMGLQLERKRAALQAKINQQNNDYFVNSNNIINNNNIGINNIKESIEISDEDISRRIRQECRNIGLTVSDDALKGMVAICSAIIENDQRQDKKQRKRPADMLAENMNNESLKKIKQSLLLANQQEKNPSFDNQALPMNNTKISDLTANIKSKFHV